MRNLVVAALILLNFTMYAQDTQYSQFYSNPLYLNPAFGGTGHNSRIALNHRILWPNLPEAFASYSISIDYSADEYNSGFGFILHTDREGTVNMQTTTGSFIYSYQIVISKELVIRPAMKFGHVARAACLSFPTQNTHGYEIAHLGAIANCIRILMSYCQQ